MICPNCNKNIKDGSKFCIYCGSTTEDQGKTIKISSGTCPQCGATVSEGKKFCKQCGASLEGGNTPQQDAFAPEPQQNNEPAPVQNNQAVPQQNNTVQFITDETAKMDPVQSVDPSSYAQQQGQGKKKSKKPLIITLVIILIVLIAAAAVMFVVVKPFDNKASEEQTQVESNSEEGASANRQNLNVKEEDKTSANTTDQSKTVSAIAANGTALSGTVRLKNGYVIPDSDIRQYSESEIAALGLNEAELCIAWNEPYARAGYKFKNSGLQTYFESMPWYKSTGFSGTLGGIPGANTNTIKAVAGNSAWKNLATN